MSDTISQELILRRNYVERLKNEKQPLDILPELPALIAKGYESISEDDIVRLQWHGLYHDKPKVGYFMLRPKTPSGVLTPAQLRTIGNLSVQFGRSSAELSTRQDVQIHWIQLAELPEILAALAQVGLTSQGACGDCVRNLTGCPVAGLDAAESFDAMPVIREVSAFLSGNRAYSDLPRKHKITIATCAHQCNAPEINCVALVGLKRVEAGRERLGFALRVGGGLSTVPRLARHLDVFVEVADVLPVLQAILDVWRQDPKYRLSRVKSRLKFMVDDYGAAGFRELIEAKLGRRLEDLPEPPKARGRTEHLGVNPQKQPGLYYVGFPVSEGRCTGEQLVRLADLVESYGGDVRLTRQQNFIVTGVPEARLDEVIGAVEEIGFPLQVNRLRGSSIACTGQPLCNFAVAETKTKLAEIVEHLEHRFGQAVQELRLGVDGCPHACAHHWIQDIGLQGSTLRERGAAGEKLEAYEIYLRGGLGAEAAIGKAVVRRVPSEQAKYYVERLVRAYLEGRRSGESPQAFWSRHTDEELNGIAAGDVTAPTA